MEVAKCMFFQNCHRKYNRSSSTSTQIDVAAIKSPDKLKYYDTTSINADVKNYQARLQQIDDVSGDIIYGIPCALAEQSNMQKQKLDLAKKQNLVAKQIVQKRAKKV